MSGSALRVRGLVKRFGGVAALRGVNVDVDAGRCLGVVGPNGAGKSTLIAAVAGLRRPNAGRVSWNTTDVTSWSPVRRVRAGLVWTHQAPRSFRSLTVREHLEVVVGAELHRVREELDALGLGDRLDVSGSRLSPSEAKLLDLARAFCLRPRALLLDEPFAGLDAGQTTRSIERLRRARAEGVAVAVVEHRLEELLDVADRVLVLADGEVVAEGEPRSTLASDAVRLAYWGEATT